MYGHIKKRKRRGEFLEFCRYLRSLPRGAALHNDHARWLRPCFYACR